MITNIHKNRMGTVSFDATFPGQRKAQDFIVYPLHSGNRTDRIMVQSSKRIGYIYLDDGKVDMTPSIPGGAYGHHMILATRVCKLSAEDLFSLKAQIFATANGDAGRSINHIIGTDNSGALEIFGATA